MELRQFIDHTLLHPTATPEDIIQLCNEAAEHLFHAVCVNSCHAKLAVDTLRFERQKVAVTVGFPLGACSTDAKLAETKKCLELGVDEIDMVMNIGFLKAGLTKSVREEISSIKEIMGDRILKVILETCYLSNEEISLACKVAAKAGADFVKTSTGFGPGGATMKDVALMVETVGPEVHVKASGGIKTGKDALAYIGLGAQRIGTSNGIKIINTQ